MNKLDTSIYLVTDSGGLGEEDFLSRVIIALQNGVTLIQLREKELSTREYLSLAIKVHEITKRFSIPLLIDDRIDICLACGAEGVHLGQSDMPISIARQILGDSMIIGATAKTVEQAREAYEQGADYLGVGAIYPTTTKVKTVLTSVGTLDSICKSVPIPVNAIGGLNKDNLDILRGTQLDGICVVSAIMKAKDTARAVIELREAFEKIK